MFNKMKKINRTSVVVSILSILTFTMGLTDIISALTPALPERLVVLRSIFPYVVRSTVRLGTAMIGLSLIFLSNSLRRRKQMAWYSIVVILAASLVLHLVKGLDVEIVFITTLLLVALFYERKEFMAKPDIPSIKQGFKALGFTLMFTLFYGVVGLFLIGRGEREVFRLGYSLSTVTNTFFLLRPAPVFDSRLIPFFFDSIYLIGFCSIIFTIYMFFRPVIYRSDSSDEDRKKARELFEKFGRNFASEIMLLPGKYYFINKNDSGVIVYKPVGSYAIVMTEPVCFAKDQLRNTKEFISFCKGHGWSPVFGGVSKEFANKVEKIGMKSISMGRMATVDLQDFDLSGSQKKPLRYSINVMERLGYCFKIFNPPISEENLRRYKQTSDHWLKNEKGEELRFTVGYFDKKYIGNSGIAEVCDKAGKNVAFVNFYEYGDYEIAIDLMRHKNVPPDTMLYLFTKLIIWAKENRYKKLNLGMVLLYGMGGKGTTAEEKVVKIVANRFGKIYNLKGLYVFKNKFQPEWTPVYFTYPSNLDLAGALIASMRIK